MGSSHPHLHIYSWQQYGILSARLRIRIVGAAAQSSTFRKSSLTTHYAAGLMQAGQEPAIKPRPEGTGCGGMKMPPLLWLAELGRPDTTQLFSVRHSSVDYSKTGVGIANQLKWSWWENEVALYDSPHAHHGDPLATCTIVGRRMQFPEALDLMGKGSHWDCPLGIASGSMVQRMARKDDAFKVKKDSALTAKKQLWREVEQLEPLLEPST